MQRLFIPLAFLILTVVLSSGCDPYRKAIKSKNIAEKDTAAMYYFNKKKYDQAVFLFDELRGIYRGTPRAEEMYYYYAYCRYYLGELLSAAVYFEDFIRQFPQSKHTDDFQYLHAKCYYLLSDPHYLDQKYTYKAIDKMQLYISRYPESSRKEQCQEIITELRERLARKAFEKASLYQKIGYHRAAVEAYQVMMDKFPDSKYREEAQFNLVQSGVDLAGISTKGRKRERYEEAIAYYRRFEARYPESQYIKQAESLRDFASRNLEKVKDEEQLGEEEKVYYLFSKTIGSAIETQSEKLRIEKYRLALKQYQELKELNPESKYLPQAEKDFRTYEKKWGASQPEG